MDFDKAYTLLHVMDKARLYGSQLQWLHDAALKELHGMHEVPKEKEPARMPPIERSMRGATASTYSEQGKDETPPITFHEESPKRLPGSESYFEATKENK